MQDTAFIGDDRALTELIEFLIAHAKDRRCISGLETTRRHAGLNPRRHRTPFGRRRIVPDLPVADYSDAGIAQWKAYMEETQRPPNDVSGLRRNDRPGIFQCLARRVDWGHPDAILANRGEGRRFGPATSAAFPEPGKTRADGLRSHFVFRGFHRAEIRKFASALAQLGDEDMFEQTWPGTWRFWLRIGAKSWSLSAASARWMPW